MISVMTIKKVSFKKVIKNLVQQLEKINKKF